MKCLLLAAAVALVSVQAGAADSVYWGMRKGETARILKRSGINTSHARIVLSDEADHTVIRANCKTGIFTNALGITVQFHGRSNIKDDPINYVYTVDGSRLTGEASGQAVLYYVHIGLQGSLP